MTTPARINFTVYQGATFNEELRWESSYKTYIPITDASRSAPLVVTAPGHGVPLNWRVKFTNILGMTDLNNNEEYNQVSSLTANTVTINNINSLGFKPYTSGGILEYNTPIDMAGYTARMQIRESIDSTVVIQELSTANNKIVIDNTKKTITLNIPASTTSTFTFTTAVYGLNLTSGGGQVTPFCTGILSLIREAIR